MGSGVPVLGLAGATGRCLPADAALEATAPGQRTRGRSEYVRTLRCALLLWEPWHDALPACCFSEEINEASLSRLGTAMQQHPN